MRKQNKKILGIVAVILSIVAIAYLGGFFSVLFPVSTPANILTTNWWSGGPDPQTSVNGVGSQYWDPIDCDYKTMGCSPIKSDSLTIYDKTIKIMGSCGGSGAFAYYFNINNQFDSPALNPSGEPLSNGQSPISAGTAQKRVFIYDDSACIEGNNCPVNKTKLIISPCLTWNSGSGNHVERYSYEFYDDKILMNFTNLNQNYRKGENIVYNLDVFNNFGEVIINACANFKVDSFFSSEKEYCTGKVQIPMGKKSLSISVPVLDSSQYTFSITPTAKIYSASGKISNANLYLYDDNGKLQGLTHNSEGINIYLGKYQGEPQSITVNAEVNETFYRFANNSCSKIQILGTEKTKDDYNLLSDCQIHIASLPPPTTPPTFSSILSKIADWFKNLFESLKLLSVTGESTVLPGSNQNYTILLSVNQPNSDYSKGNYQVQYANWALVDSSNNIKQQGSWEQINGVYSKTISIIIPSEVNKYVLIAVINQYDMVYDYPTKTWKTTKDEVVSKEAYNLEAKLPVPTITAPSMNKFLDIINSIINWFKNLFGLGA